MCVKTTTPGNADRVSVPGKSEDNKNIISGKPYHRKYDLEILKKISRQDPKTLVSQLALRIASRMERERRSGGIQ